MRRISSLVILLISVAFPVVKVSASDELEQPRAHGALAADDVAVTGSAASFDKRLPPVIPGESIKHNGRSMRVWSSSGPVPVGQVPQAPQAPVAGGNSGGAGQLPANVGVIVDNRPGQRKE